MSFRLPTFGFFLLLLLTACGQLGSPTAPDLSPTAVTGGSVVAWGRNDYGQINVPALPAGVSYTAVEGGFEHSLAVRSDGQIVAWGSNNDGQTNVLALPEGTSYTAVAGGSYHSVALRSDGQVVAWGQNNVGQTDVPALPEGMSYTDVAAGSFHNLAVRSDGQVVAWGYNSLGQTDVPALPEGLRYTDVAGGAYHSLAVRSDEQVVAWGYNDYGQTDVPALPAGVSYTSVAGGGFHSVALRSDGQAVAWGYNRNGQTNVPALPEGSKYIGVAAGGNHSLAITQKPKQDQTISFTSTAPTNANVGGSYTPTATATSGLTVTFGTSTPSTCTFSSGSVSFIAAGTCTVTADQAGNEGYNPAAQVPQSFTISLPPVQVDTYTIDLTTAPLNRILYSVKVGQGVTYSGTGTANKDPIRVDGYRYLSGNKLGGNQAKVVSVSGDNVLTVVKAGTNTPNPMGGELDIKPAQSFGGPSLGKNGLVTLKSITVGGVSTNGAKLVLYGNGQPLKTISLTKTPSQTLTLNEPNVGFIQVRANDSFTVDDVVFEIAALR